VFVYMSATNRFLEPVLGTLKARGVPTVALIRGDKAPKAEPLVQAPNISYLHTLVDLKRLAPRCRLAITHGGALTASLLLQQEIRLLCCPEDLEKAVVAKRLEERGLAFTANWFAPDAGSVRSAIDRLLDADEAPPHLAAFAASRAGLPAGDTVTKIVTRCEHLLENHR
jgi:UDP:flavonoid glycosyltransferase YjiC (YdhE family)